MRWFRAYEEAVNDPKIQRLPDAIFKMWFNLLCLASMNNGTLPALDSIAFSLRLSEAKCEERLHVLIKAGLIDENEMGLSPHNWTGRQYKSDVSTNRVKQFRKRRGNVSSAVSETRPETETETETEEKEENSLRSSKEIGAEAPPTAKVEGQNGHSKPKAKRKHRLPDGWMPEPADNDAGYEVGLIEPEIAAEFLKFQGWAISNGSLKSNWNWTWRNWLRTAGERKAQRVKLQGQ